MRTKTNADAGVTPLQRQKIDIFFSMLQGKPVQIRPLAALLKPATYYTGWHMLTSANGLNEQQVAFLRAKLDESITLVQFKADILNSSLFPHTRGGSGLQFR